MTTERSRLRWTIIATILGSTVVFLDATVVNVALPAISDDLDTGLADQQWVVEAYLLALVSLLLVGGSLGDQFGNAMMVQPVFAWSVNGGGMINQSGLFTAGNAPGGPFTVTAAGVPEATMASIIMPVW